MRSRYAIIVSDNHNSPRRKREKHRIVLLVSFTAVSIALVIAEHIVPASTVGLLLIVDLALKMEYDINNQEEKTMQLPIIGSDNHNSCM